MKIPPPPAAPLSLLLLFQVLCGSILRAGQTDIEGPPGSGEFGRSVTVLPGGNIVVTDPYFDLSDRVKDAGAVYLYNPSGALISRLTGAQTDDRVGNGGITVLTNGNYVVRSYRWDNGKAVDAGAVTWCNGVTGLNGVVSVENSLAGSSREDFLGFSVNRTAGGVVALSNGNYVVCSPDWDNGAVTAAGAVTWGNGTAGTAGVVSAANSLVGAAKDDQVGGMGAFSGGTGPNTGVTPLEGGDYVVCCPMWDNGAVRDAGAAVWCSGTAGRTGTVAEGGALTGARTMGRVGLGGAVSLAGGNYVIISPSWRDETLRTLGAVTWRRGGESAGAVDSTNSLTGSQNGDNAGSGGVVALSDGNYVVRSPSWSNGQVGQAGAVTWCNGSTGATGRITADNSLTGSAAADRAGGGGVAVLPGGRCVVISPDWDNGAVVDAGAVTWMRGGEPFSGVISAANSLTGSVQSDSIGRNGVTVLGNGNYVVASPRWDHGNLTDTGAVTWCNGTSGLTGPVSEENSLVGSSAGDSVGGAVTALSNGNYVVSAPGWDNGAVEDAGAVVWCPGATGRRGPVTEAVSLTGSVSEDMAGSGGVTGLRNGAYVVASPLWDNNGVRDAGAVTWCGGVEGAAGRITSDNSLTGGREGDRTGSGGVTALRSGRWAVFSPDIFTQGPAKNFKGAVTLGDGEAGLTGRPDLTNSVLEPVAPGLGENPSCADDPAGLILYVGQPRNNLVGLLSPGIPNRAEILVEQPRGTKLAPGATVDFGAVSPGGSKAVQFILKNTGYAVLQRANASITGNPVFTVSSSPVEAVPPGRDSAFIITFHPSAPGMHSALLRVTAGDTDKSPFEIILTGVRTEAGAAVIRDLAGPPGSGQFGHSVTVLPNGNFVVTDPYFDLPGLVRFAGAVYLYGADGTLISTLTGSAAGDQAGLGGVTVLKNGNWIVSSPRCANGAAYGAGAVTWGSAETGVSGVVSAANSLVGSTMYDSLGGEPPGMESGGTVIALENGNYVVCSPDWDSGGAVNAGAVTWCDGTTGTRGPVTAENSLTGAAGDRAGSGGVTLLRNGNYTVSSPGWSGNRGAVTWGGGGTGVTGVISAENSLTGISENDWVGLDAPPLKAVTALGNGHYVVCSPFWTKESGAPGLSHGAVTWCDGETGRAGVVTAANSLTGSTYGDRVGYLGITELPGGGYAVISPSWSGPGAIGIGAVTWCDATAGLTGPVTEENSLTGSLENGRAGSGGVSALQGGACVVSSPRWNGTRGAVTWCPAGGRAGERVTPENSLTGSVPFTDAGAVTVLRSGNYTVKSSAAVTWCDGATGRTGEISPANSLTGSSFNDYPGGGGNLFYPGGVTALENGHYLVASPSWRGGGALTLGNGHTGLRGEISASNSFTGGAGGSRVLTFSGGHYAMISPYRSGGGFSKTGAVTLFSATRPPAGTFSLDNSVFGAAPEGGVSLNVTFRAPDSTFLVGRPADNLVTLFRYHPSGPPPSLAVRSSGCTESPNGGGFDFGAVESGKSFSVVFTLRNTGASALTIDSITTDGVPFAVTGAPSPGDVVPPGESRELTLTFTPDSAGLKSAALRITGGETSMELFALRLTGTGKAAGGTGDPFGQGGGSPRAERLADGRVGLSFKALPGAAYLLQRSTDLQTWTEGAPVTADAEGNILWSDEAPPAGKVFYRLKVP